MWGPDPARSGERRSGERVARHFAVFVRVPAAARAVVVAVD